MLLSYQFIFSICFQNLCVCVCVCVCVRHSKRKSKRDRKDETSKYKLNRPRLPVPQLFSSLLFDFLCLYIQVLRRQTQTQHSHMTPFRQTLHKNIQISKHVTVALLGTPRPTHTYCIQILFFHCAVL